MDTASAGKRVASGRTVLAWRRCLEAELFGERVYARLFLVARSCLGGRRWCIARSVHVEVRA